MHGAKEAWWYEDIALLCKLASVVVHAEEMLSSNGHELDRIALQAAIDDPAVKQWIKDMGPLAPLKRKP